MKHIAIVGGGISGLTAAFELEKARQQNPEIDWHLYESSDRLGGIVQTTHHDNFVLEGGPDGWVTEKPFARDLAIELGLKNDIIHSNDDTRKTYICLNNTLHAIPDHMRLMVPSDLSALEGSTLFSASAKQAYANELANAAQLKQQAPDTDESIASFVLRHFGEEVLTTLAAPLLSGVFGGDVHKLSVRAVMAPFVAMEREHGSLILALQSKRKADKAPQPIFTSLRSGVASLTDALIAKLPAERLHLNRSALSIKREGKRWLLRTTGFLGNESRTSKKHLHHILLATPVDITRKLLEPLAPEAAAFLPTDASSAILCALAFDQTFPLPQGFGFLVPAATQATTEPQLLAATFVDQKFPYRAPANTHILRAFFGGTSADALSTATDEAITQASLAQLQNILGPLPTPTFTTVQRWPRSLPQYEVGHLDRIAQLESLTPKGLSLLGNSYRGVGLPDLIRDAKFAVKSLLPTLAQTPPTL